MSPIVSEPTHRTPSAIANELLVLNGLLTRVPPTSAFGDDNHEAITAQIRVITEGMTENQMLEEYEDEDLYILSAALDAYEWMQEDGEPVSEGWREMVAI